VLVLAAPRFGKVLWIPHQMRYPPPGQAPGPHIHPSLPLVPTGRRALPLPHVVGTIHQVMQFLFRNTYPCKPLRSPWPSVRPYGGTLWLCLASALQLACCSPSTPYRGRIVRRGDADDIAYAYLHLQVTRARMMIMREEHQHMMRNHISLIRMA
jgi:hypothetical protein